ncbi:MAG: guanylate kinase [Lentisphaerae bacterium]|jgi:guanylate kinase|nr:guanylate kinase [Lentisphaerota bacterium]MBT4814603.1 guanylate kinase [Lentisphaerota bacterium]MBT5610130.1 guanylate kinase [Lentisphaerota bacterium]MBT7053578.1 guanylate kinase [Lentisphaerota bacterium]MBT7842118.1 guanylate kinase [Lentisphaerota bacterium]
MSVSTIRSDRYGSLIVVSGPSGAGKSTVCRALREVFPPLHFSVSCTTRAPRAGEVDGEDYHFVSPEEFLRQRDAGEFLEWAEVHANWYGTLREEVEERVFGGTDVLLDIDVQGARQVRESLLNTDLGTLTTFVFFGPPSLPELEKRLRGRGTETEEAIIRRLTNAREEMVAWAEYDFLVVNETVAVAVRELSAILVATHCAVERSDQGWDL